MTETNSAARSTVPSALSDAQLRRSLIIALLLAALLPPFVGGTLMGLVGFYPLPELYLVFLHYTGPYVLGVVLIGIWLASRAADSIIALTRMESAQAAVEAQRMFALLPWSLLLAVTVYAIFGALSTDFSLEALGVRHYTTREHWLNQLGQIPAILITCFPIFFYLVDCLGRYLGPRGVTATAVPVWVKFSLLGIVTPLLTASLLIGYYYNRSGYFEPETLALGLSLLGLAVGGTWFAWRSLRQGIAPLQVFIDAHTGRLDARFLENLTPMSLDELGPLTARIAALLSSQKRLTDHLQRSESLANAVIENAGALVLVLDREGRIVRFNHACETLSAMTFAEVEGRFPWETFLPPEDADRVHQQAFEALARQPQAMQGHYTNEWQSKDGRRHLTEWFNTVQLDADGRMDFMICVGADVTERSAAEHAKDRQREDLEALIGERTAELADALEMNQQVLAASVIGIAVYQDSGACVLANEACARLIGGTTQQMLRENFRTLPSWKISGMFDEAVATLGDGISRLRELHMVTSYGREAWFECSFARFTRRGKAHLVVLTTDTTLRKQAETNLIRARDEAQLASRAKSEFLSRMSHELRTPLNAILGFSQVLEVEPALGAEQLSYVGEIHRAGDHLLELINDLLDLSRIESGKLAIVVEVTALHPVIKQAMQIVQPMLATRRVVLSEHCDPQLSLVADSTRLRQVLVNLLSNAVKYNQPGGRVDIACRCVDAGHVRVRVTDTGPGLEADQLARMFRPFERLGAEFSAVDGAGIGLALSKQLAELMGGTLGVESTPGQGSTFWIELPLAKPADEPAPPLTLATEGERQRVLYVEDNAANLRVVEAMLRRQPTLQLLSATNGEHGLELARRTKPDLILLDIHLPGMDGYDVLAALQGDAKTRDIPVIALSAEAMPLDIETGLRAGFRHYLTKPVNLKELLDVMTETLRQRVAG